MATNIAGMFNMATPEQMRQEYLAANMVSPAQMGQQPLLNQLVSMSRNAGAMMGSGLNQLAGGTVPGEAEATQMDQIVRTIDESNVSLDKKFDLMAAALGRMPGTADKVLALRERAAQIRAEAGKEAAGTPLIVRLQKARDALPANDPRRIEIDKQIAALGRGNVSPGAGEGTPSLSDINTGTNMFKNSVKPYKDAVDAAEQALTAIKVNSPTADAQVERALVKLQGDSNIGVQELQLVVNTGSFPQRVINTFSKWATGQISDATTQERVELLNAMRDASVEKYNTEHAKTKKILTSSKLDKGQVEDIVGAPLLTTAQLREKARAETPLTEQEVIKQGAAYDPAYEYRIINGKLKRRLKGQ